jgi:hypothetical protein
MGCMRWYPGCVAWRQHAVQPCPVTCARSSTSRLPLSAPEPVELQATCFFLYVYAGQLTGLNRPVSSMLTGKPGHGGDTCCRHNVPPVVDIDTHQPPWQILGRVGSRRVNLPRLGKCPDSSQTLGASRKPTSFSDADGTKVELPYAMRTCASLTLLRRRM